MSAPVLNAPYIEWALYYASRGVPVFPLAAHTKIPIGGHGVLDATTDEKQIRDWWTKYPNANIGGACGYKFDALDVDQGGAEEFRKHDDPKKINCATKTVKGGTHVLYAPSLVPLKNGVKCLPGLDVRTKGGYIVMPPSFVSEEKGSKIYEGHYEWRPGKELNGQILQEVPRWVIDAFKEGTSKPPVGLPEKILEGDGRNSHLFSFGCSLRRKGCGRVEIESSVHTVNQERCVPPLDERELGRIIENCLGYAPTQPYQTFKEQAAEARGERTEVGWTCLADVEQESVPWLFDRRLAKGMFSLLQGDPGEGKSTIARVITSMVTKGKAPSFWGLTLEEPRDVIWLTKEESLKHSVVPALSRMGADLRRVHSLNIEADEEGRIPNFYFDDWGIQQLREKIEATQAVLVVIDPLVSFFDEKTDIHRQNETRGTLGRLIQLGACTGVVPLGIIHLNKGQSSNALYRAIGSIDFPAAARTVFMVGHDPDDRDNKALVQIKNNLGPFAEPIGFRIEQDGTVTFDEISPLTAERMCEAPNTKIQKEKHDACKEWLERELTYGQHLVTAMLDRAKEQGFYKTLLYSVAAEIGVARGNQPAVGRGRGPAWWARRGYDWSNHPWPDPFE